MQATPDAQTIDEFIAQYPVDVQAKLKDIRRIIREEAPEATEKISYGIPTFYLHGNLVHFSAYKHHIGFYPGAAPIAHLKEELRPYKTAKGSIQFPLDQPLPVELIRKIVRLAISRNMEKLQ